MAAAKKGLDRRNLLRMQKHEQKHRAECEAAQRLKLALSEPHRAWFAALIDGEGTIGGSVIAPRKSRPSRARAAWAIHIYNSNLELLHEAQSRWPNSHVKPRKLYKNAYILQRRQFYYWYITGVENAKAFLRCIRPYLIVKAPQADLLYAMLCYSGLPTKSLDVNLKRIELARKIQQEYAKGRVL